MATIKDIAKRAGVSSATVSRVINNSGYVSEETRKAVDEAVNELNYVPNRQAQNLRRGATKTLGIITTSLTPTVIARVESFMQFANDAGYTTTLFNTYGNPQREIEALERLKGKELDGVFIIYRANEWSEIEYYIPFGPIVTLHNIDNIDIDIPSVFIDHYEGYQMILNDLWANGARTFLNIYGLSTGVNTKRRLQAYADFSKEHQPRPYELGPYFNVFEKEDVESIIKELEQQPEVPDAIIVHSDQMASFFISHFQKRALKMPENLSIVGFDNLIISDLMNFTTVDYSIVEQGRNACRLLLNNLEKEHYDLVPLEFKLIKRGTTK